MLVPFLNWNSIISEYLKGSVHIPPDPNTMAISLELKFSVVPKL